jgi:hypothetical protein
METTLDADLQEFCKPTPGLEPGTPSLRVNSRALTPRVGKWREVA